VTFMASGQKVLDGTTKGGWYRAGDNLRQDLITLGLPNRSALTAPTPTASAPAAPGPATPASPAPAQPAGPTPWPWVAAGIGLLLAAAVAATVALRRRPAT
jgi:hypothetical protein